MRIESATKRCGLVTRGVLFFLAIVAGLLWSLPTRDTSQHDEPTQNENEENKEANKEADQEKNRDENKKQGQRKRRGIFFEPTPLEELGELGDDKGPN